MLIVINGNSCFCSTVASLFFVTNIRTVLNTGGVTTYSRNGCEEDQSCVQIHFLVWILNIRNFCDFRWGACLGIWEKWRSFRKARLKSTFKIYWNPDLRQGCRMEFLDHFFNFWDFSRPKSYHSNLPIAFIVDHLKPNGFQYHIDQARNCPFGLPDGRWHHVRLRHRLLRNRKKCKSFKQFSEKRMKLELIKIALH